MITGYVGEVGAGKTMNMVYDLMESMRWGRRVVSNTPIEFMWRGKLLKAEHIKDADDFKHALIYEQHCTLAIDEASVFLPNNYWNKIPPQIIAKFAQSRHFGMDMAYTSQGWGHTVKRLRDLTNEVFLCKQKRFMGLPGLPAFPFITRKWNNKFKRKEFRIKTVSSKYFEAKSVFPAYLKSTATSYKRIKHLIKYTRVIYPVQAREIFKCYDTLWTVEGSLLVKMGRITDKNFKNAARVEADNEIKENAIIHPFPN
jgi:hypothetical protein